MINIKPTPNYAGVEIIGDFYDFNQVYEALHQIIGEEDEYPEYFSARLRVLGLCYDLRHANMGNRGYAYLDHGIDEDTMKWMGIVGAKKNLYLAFKTYYPEILFIVMALNDFVEKYKRGKAGHPHWDLTIVTIRKFQATVIQSLSETVKPQTFKLMLSNMSKYSVDFSNYFTQYLDQLNIRFLHWDKEKRLKNISIMAKRIAEKGKEYQKAKQQILEVAYEHDCSVNEIKFNEEYPDYDKINW